ncbi:hypothetical protein QF027_009242 [Streptomyces canus]|nr:hypothetical protein [Streptomyces canus]
MGSLPSRCRWASGPTICSGGSPSTSGSSFRTPCAPTVERLGAAAFRTARRRGRVVPAQSGDRLPKGREGRGPLAVRGGRERGRGPRARGRRRRVGRNAGPPLPPPDGERPLCHARDSATPRCRPVRRHPCRGGSSPRGHRVGRGMSEGRAGGPVAERDRRTGYLQPLQLDEVTADRPEQRSSAEECRLRHSWTPPDATRSSCSGRGERAALCLRSQNRRVKAFDGLGSLARPRARRRLRKGYESVSGA